MVTVERRKEEKRREKRLGDVVVEGEERRVGVERACDKMEGEGERRMGVRCGDVEGCIRCLSLRRGCGYGYRACICFFLGEDGAVDDDGNNKQ